MLLLPEHRAIFVHIPKTGGQTLERLLGHAHQRNHHAIRGLPDDWPQWFRFTFVRHPLDRFISACNYSVEMASRHPSRYNRRASLGSVERFRVWLLECEPNLGAVVERMEAERVLRRIVHFRPQVKWLKATRPQFIGRFEHFHNDLHTLLRLLAIDRSTIRRLARLYRHDLKVLGYKANRFP